MFAANAPVAWSIAVTFSVILECAVAKEELLEAC